MLIDIEFRAATEFEEALEIRSTFVEILTLNISLVEDNRSILTKLEDVHIVDEEIDDVVRWITVSRDTAVQLADVMEVLIEMREAKKGWQ